MEWIARCVIVILTYKAIKFVTITLTHTEIVILDKDGKDMLTIGQSNACLRYIGGISGSYPEGNVQRALVDEVLDSSEDLLGLIVPPIFMEDENEKKEAVKALMKDKYGLPYWFKKFEARLEENEKRGNKNGFFVGDSITIADLKYVSYSSTTLIMINPNANTKILRFDWKFEDARHCRHTG